MVDCLRACLPCMALPPEPPAPKLLPGVYAPGVKLMPPPPPPKSPRPSPRSLYTAVALPSLRYLYGLFYYADESPRIKAANTQPTSSTTAIDFQVATHPAFDLVESVVTDGKTGARLTELRTVHRGTIREETLRFRVNAPIGPLRRTTTTAMRILGSWQKVATESLEMGVYAPGPQLHEFRMPTAVIPTTAFAKGRFRTEVVYASDAHGPSTPLRREWDIEFSIV